VNHDHECREVIQVNGTSYLKTSTTLYGYSHL